MAGDDNAVSVTSMQRSQVNLRETRMDSAMFARQVVSTFDGYLLNSMHHPSHPALSHQSADMN